MKKTTRSILTLIILISVLGMIALFIGRTNSTQATEQPEKEYDISLNSGDDTEPTVQLNTSTPDPGQTGAILAQEIQELSQRWQETNKKTGWIHIVSKYQVDQDEARTWPDGTPMENEFFNDQWFLLDDRGYKIKHVSIQQDLDGNVIQVSAYRDNTGYNLTLGVIPPPFHKEDTEFVWDFGFPKSAGRFSESLEKVLLLKEGLSVVLYSFAEEYPTPMNFSAFNEPVTAIISKGYYELETGKLLMLERVLIMTNGEERITESMELVSWETGVEPAAEVLAYLEATYADDFKLTSEFWQDNQTESE